MGGRKLKEEEAEVMGWSKESGSVRGREWKGKGMKERKNEEKGKVRLAKEGKDREIKEK